jgi:hypothetical protein
MRRRTPDKPLAASQTRSRGKGDSPLSADAKTGTVSEDRFRPWLLAGMTALLVARPLFPSESAAQFGDGLLVVMLWIALAAFWLVGRVGGTVPIFVSTKMGLSRLRPLRLGWTDAAVLLLIVWHSVAALVAVAQGSPRPALNMLWEWIGMGLCYFLARQLIVTSRQARAVVAVMIALAVGVAGYGLYQACYEMPCTRAEYATNPDQAMRDADLWFPPDSPERKQFEDRLANTEPMATFALTNSLAGFLATWLVVAVGVVAGSVRDRKRLAVCLIPLMVCLLLTQSRSGYAAACVGVALVWWLHTHKEDAALFRKGPFHWRWPAVAAGVVTLLVVAAWAVEGPSVFGRALKSFGYRVQYWQSSVRLMADHPWFGCGPGNFQAVYTQYKLPEASEEVADPHNFILEIGATAGVPAALMFVLVLGCFIRGVGRGAWDAGCEAAGLAPRGWDFALVAVLLGGALGFPLGFLLGLFSQAPSGVAILWLALPLAAATVWLLWGWIREGALPSWLPAVGIAALLVDLLAAGGIGYPGVACTFWLLLAVGLEGRRVREFRSLAVWPAMAAVMALAVACYYTAYRPVLNCQAELHLANRNHPRAAQHLAAAAAADPWSAEPWRQLAAAEIDAWQREPNLEDWQRFTQARDKTLTLAPRAAVVWLAAGDWMSQASARKDEHGKPLVDDALPQAVGFYRRAVAMYPNSVTYRAKLADALLAAGDREGFRREADAALRLDAITPHLDKKLSGDVRKRLTQEGGRGKGEGGR